MTTATIDIAQPPRVRTFDAAPEFLARAAVGGLFLTLAWHLGSDFMKTGRPTDLLLLVGEALVVILTCLRRRATIVDCRTVARVVTTASMVSPLLIRPVASGGLISETAAAVVAGIGLLIVIVGKLSLGYSFGLLPANRGIKDRGMYRLVRHPIYLGYLITHVPFLLAHPSPRNLLVITIADMALIVRTFYEEQTLSLDPAYSRYRERVHWRLFPGIF
jgi:protein-S-isoprenylcysteine O-methyltransferase Ste14